METMNAQYKAKTNKTGSRIDMTNPEALLAYVRELESYKQDAERYRWLRDNGDGFEITVREVNEDGGEEWIAGYSGPELDIAIDTARKGEGE